MNWYPEQVESGLGQSAFALYPTSGLKLFAALGGASVRSLFTINNRLFATSGVSLYEVLANGTANNLGTIVNDTLPSPMTASPQQLLLISGGQAYVLTLATNVLTQLPAGTFQGPVSLVAFVGGFFLSLIAGSQRVNASAALDATTWPGLSTTLVSTFPDNVTSMVASHGQLALLGPKSSVWYYLSGNFPFPFDVALGSEMEQGTIARFSPVNLDNSIFWLGGDERGAAVAWRAAGYTPQRVSNHAVEYAWQQYPIISDAISYAFQDQGHSFWQIYFPSANATWVYDVATNQWHQRGFWNVNKDAFDAHHSQCHAFAFNKHLVGDWSSGNIYQMSIPVRSGAAWSFADDNGSAIRRVRRTPHVSIEKDWVFHHQLQVDLETGLGPIPPLQGLLDSTSFILQDANLQLWQVNVAANGTLVTRAVASGAVSVVKINDPTKAATWQLGVTIAGLLTTTSIALDVTQPTSLAMVSIAPATNYAIQVTLAGLLQTVNQGIVARGPMINLRWSDDGGHSWSNEYSQDCGQAGQFKQRVIWRRLGRSRARVYEVNASDPVPYRIIDAYLLATPGYTPQKRIPKQYSEVA